MVVGIKDVFKLIGIMIVSACAVWVCTLFLNFKIDLRDIEGLLTTADMFVFYNALVLTGKVVCWLSGGCLTLTSVILLGFYIKHYIDSHRKELGILKAMGYTNFAIAKGFWVFGLSVGIGTTIGYIGAHCMMPLFYATQNEKDFIPDVVMNFHPILIVYLIIIPSLIFAVLAILYGCMRLGSPVLDLLRGKESKPVKPSKRNTELPFLEELKKSTIKQRKSLVFFIAFSSFCYSDMVQMSISMKDLSSFVMGAMIMMIGLILASVSLILAISTVVKSSRKTLAMMKVFGYSSAECKKAILSGYRPIAYIGFVIGTVYQYALLKIMVSIVFKDVIGTPEYNFDVTVCIITLISFAILYELLMYFYSKQINHITVKEVMLDGE